MATLYEKFITIKNTFANFLFPRTCFVCGAEGEWLCVACVARLNLTPSNSCPGCGRVTAHGETCLTCKPKSSLDGLTTFARYHEVQGIGKLIKALKYRRATDVVSALPLIWAEVLGNAAIIRLEPLKKAVLVAVPLHKSRFAERGFNQAELIAKSLAELLGKDFVGEGLERVKKTKQQITLKKAERLENVRGAFMWVMRKSVPDSVILVDDVYTTGATMQEAAQALKESGVRFVWGVALARD